MSTPISPDAVDNTDRALYLYRWRRALGWDTTATAARLSVTARTINLWETGAQPMPDARWLLFVLLVQQAAEKQMKMDLEQVRPGGPDVAVVLGPDGTPVDVVSRENYAGHVTDRLIGKGMVASVVTDRETGRERLHNQSFDLADNEGFVHAAEQWAAYRNIIVDAHERWSYHLHREMVQQALRAEMRNPQIGTLKAAIEQAAAERNAVGDDEPVEAHHAAERKLRAAIWALQEAIAQGVED